jgi:hypothetical protein
MAEEEEVAVEQGPLPTPGQLAGSYGSNPTKDVEGNHYEFKIIASEEEGNVFELRHKTCFLPSADAPFAGTWITDVALIKGTWELAEGPPLEAPAPSVEEKSEGKTEEAEAPVEEAEADAPAEENAAPQAPPTAEITFKSATKSMEDVEDGAFVVADQPCTRYNWKFRISEDLSTITLLDSNYPVCLTSARWEQGSSIEMKYMDLVLNRA